jgi:hypothetical protein
MKNEERWPAKCEITRISDSLLGEVFNIFLIVCIANREQIDTANEVINFNLLVPTDDEKVIAVGLVTQKKLENIQKAFNPRAKRWRGQYQPISKAITSACQKELKLPTS